MFVRGLARFRSGVDWQGLSALVRLEMAWEVAEARGRRRAEARAECEAVARGESGDECCLGGEDSWRCWS